MCGKITRSISVPLPSNLAVNKQLNRMFSITEKSVTFDENQPSQEQSYIADEYYNMSHYKSGKILILEHNVYEGGRRKARDPAGSNADFQALKSTFEGILDFEVVHLKNATFAQIDSKLQELADEDHSTSNCIIVCVMSHGNEYSFEAYDHNFPFDRLFEKFQGDNCPTLAGKPKLFFIQCCRGINSDPGFLVPKSINNPIAVKDTVDCNKTCYKLPCKTDMLAMYATTMSDIAFTRNSGSIFMQTLCRVVKANYLKDDLLSMLTKVSNMIACDYESDCDDKSTHGKKMQPEIISRLRKKIHFNRYQRPRSRTIDVSISITRSPADDKKSWFPCNIL